MLSSENLSLVTQLCSQFFDRVDSDTLVKRILESAIRITESDRGTVFLVRETDGQAAELASLVATGMGGIELVVEAGKGVAGFVYRTKAPLLINDASADPRFFSKVDEKTHYRTETILCAPLRTPDGRTLGVVELLNSKRGRYEEDDLQVLQILALVASIALAQRREIDSLTETNEALRHERQAWFGKSSQYHLKSTHPDLQALYEKLPAFAQSDSSILIEGESGTGKEVVARVIHMRSRRRDRPFIAINCAAIPESLFEAELFGVAKGAATGTSARRGKIALASGGTLFLDEIGDLPLAVQAKLLRVLQEKTVSRVGSDEQPERVDFRVLAATHQDLSRMVQAGKFREDLFYRINVVSMRIPPLRERPGDLATLCETLLARIGAERGWRRVKKLDEAALDALRAYAWPGNIRQLQNKLESATIVGGERGELRAADFQLEPRSGAPAGSIAAEPVAPIGPLRDARDAFEHAYIQRAIDAAGGNKTLAARTLGITREGLRKALQKKSKSDPASPA
jgi:Nif-specific regulatory protein